MSTRAWTLFALAPLALLMLVALAPRQADAVQDRREALLVPAERAAAGGVRELLWALPFTLDEPARHHWRSEQPAWDAGWLLVLAVDPTLVEPRQTFEPVLYGGEQTLERVNHGHESGRVVAVLPAPRGADGWPATDLAALELWFGVPALPEQVGAEQIAEERERARRLGVLPRGAGEAARARAAAGPGMRFERREVLDDLAAQLILIHSPQELDLARGMLVPRLPR